MWGKTRRGKSFQENHVGAKHLDRFIGLLRETKPELPFVQIIVVSKSEFQDITRKHACVTCPQFDQVLKKQLWGRLFSRSVRVYMTELNNPERTLDLEMYLTQSAFYFSEIARQEPATEEAKYQLWQTNEIAAQAMFDRILHHAELIMLGWPTPNDLKPKRSLAFPNQTRRHDSKPDEVSLFPSHATRSDASPLGPVEEIPFELHTSRRVVLVHLLVNAKPATFVVDTGATNTVINARVLGLANEIPEVRFKGSEAGAEGFARHAPADLQLGALHWPKRMVVAMNLGPVEKFYGQKIDGLLGQDVLQEFKRVVFDYEAKTLVLIR